MYINKDELNKLIEIENKLAKDKKYFDDFCILSTIIENLSQKQYKYNKENYKRIKEKRKLNKNYARENKLKRW